MSTYQDRARLVLVSLVTNFAEKDEQGEWWGHDTNLGNQEEAFDQALSELASTIEEELLPKERPVKPRQSGQDAKQLINLGYNTAIQEIRGKFKEPQR